MSDKERRIDWLNEKLQRGTLRLPEPEWHREYLGEWAQQTPGPFAKLTKTPKPTGASFTYVTPIKNLTIKADPTLRPGEFYFERPSVTTKCGLCDADLQLTADDSGALVDAHRKVCSKRPLEVGDYVRLDISGQQFADCWQEGTIDRFSDKGYASVLMRETVGDYRWLWTESLRRIPRPVDEVKAAALKWDTWSESLYRAKAEADRRATALKSATIDPLDTKYDDVTLRELLELDMIARAEGWAGCRWRSKATPAQRNAVSEWRSAELRVKVAASDAARKERETTVVMGLDGEDFPW